MAAVEVTMEKADRATNVLTMFFIEPQGESIGGIKQTIPGRSYETYDPKVVPLAGPTPTFL